MIGAGGNGSIFMSHLCRIYQAWVKLGGTPFEIHLHDADTVSETNLARQCFCEADIGQPKALVLAQRLRAFFGLPVQPHISRLSVTSYSMGDVEHTDDHMFIGCVDNLEGRRAIRKLSRQTDPEGPRRKDYAARYWLDMGNAADFGQVILGGHGLPDFFDVFPKLVKAKDKDNTPSCSMAEALSKQDLFINSTVAALAGQLLWQLMRHGRLTHHGHFVNLATGRVQPIPVH